MAINDFKAEEPSNFERKCCCVLVLDISGSMAGEPIKELNNGLQQFHKEILDDSVASKRLEIGIVTFSSAIDTILKPTIAEEIKSLPTLSTTGSTKLVDGVREGIALVRTRKAYYKETGQKYYRPWIILMTDGAPDPDQDTSGLSQEIKDGMSKKDFHFLGVGVQGADMSMLASISDPKVPPYHLSGLKFGEFFKWLSDSMGAITSSKEGDKITLPSTDSWREGYTT